MQQNKKFLRSERTSDLIHKELANIIIKFCKDPRLEKVTITNVKLSKDLSIAKIYVADFIDLSSEINLVELKNKAKQILNVLNNATNFLRNQLASKMSLRKVPGLKFFYDENVLYSIKMDQVFAKIGCLSS